MHEPGTRIITAEEISRTPVIFGEADVVRTLGTGAGISGSTEGLASIHSHGGNANENLFMIDNVPVYQTNHLAGIFSVYNIDAIQSVGIYQSAVPAKYNGRLSSFIDVRTKSQPEKGHHGSARIGLPSGAFSISGPIGSKTTYLGAVRRSWLDLLTTPLLALANSGGGPKTTFRYAFTDMNAKVTHRFNDRAAGTLGIYFGDDIFKVGHKSDPEGFDPLVEEDDCKLHWGNLITYLSFDYKFHKRLKGEMSVAWLRFFSSMDYNYSQKDNYSTDSYIIHHASSYTETRNNTNDWILKGDFDWTPDSSHRFFFGGGCTLHSFIPGSSSRYYSIGVAVIQSHDSIASYMAEEPFLYLEDNWTLSDRLRTNIGINGSLFHISGKTYAEGAPRFALIYGLSDRMTLSASYSRTIQYMHQLCRMYLSLPTDQWIPVTGTQRPQKADNISIIASWESSDGKFRASAEGYFRKMKNLIEYRDEYYLTPPLEAWSSILCTGKGTAKGLDLKFEKKSGHLTGHVAYSLAWSDRTFADKNGGLPFPARFDNRHTFNLLVNWDINPKVRINAFWTGHSGNRFTLMPMEWEAPDFDSSNKNREYSLKTSLNNYRLPFYHRLDLSCMVRNRHGFWTFSLYNAYCHLNTVAITKGYNNEGEPVFKKVKMLPLIPSISYTWQF